MRYTVRDMEADIVNRSIGSLSDMRSPRSSFTDKVRDKARNLITEEVEAFRSACGYHTSDHQDPPPVIRTSKMRDALVAAMRFEARHNRFGLWESDNAETRKLANKLNRLT